MQTTNRRWRISRLLKWQGVAICLLTAATWWKGTWWKWTIGSSKILCPMWLLLTLAAFPTAFFWWRDSRRVRAKPPRTVQLMKLSGLACCILLVLAGAISTQVRVEYRTPQWRFGLTMCRVALSWQSYPDPLEDPLLWQVDPPCLEIERTHPDSLSQQLGLFIPVARILPSQVIQTISTYIVVPLWAIITPIALLTALVWWLDARQILPGHCRRCRYDLTGNTSGRCSECGTPIPLAEPADG